MRVLGYLCRADMGRASFSLAQLLQSSGRVSEHGTALGSGRRVDRHFDSCSNFALIEGFKCSITLYLSKT